MDLEEDGSIYDNAPKSIKSQSNKAQGLARGGNGSNSRRNLNQLSQKGSPDRHQIMNEDQYQYNLDQEGSSQLTYPNQ